MKINVTVDVAAVVGALNDVAQRQVPYIAKTFVNNLAADAKRQIQNRLPQVFDRPKPFTTQGIFIRKADKAANATAEVYFPDSSENSGKAAHEYIRPGALGASSRQQKKTEFLLTRMGYLPSGWVSVPGSRMPKDAWGNMPGRYYSQLIRGLRIKVTKGPPKPMYASSAKRAARMNVDYEFFAIAPGTNNLGKHGGNLPAGVYQRTGRHGEKLVQYLVFRRRASYQKRLDLDKEAQHLLASSAKQRFDEAMQTAIATINR